MMFGGFGSALDKAEITTVKYIARMKRLASELIDFILVCYSES